jgi:hypothetical protein
LRVEAPAEDSRQTAIILHPDSGQLAATESLKNPAYPDPVSSKLVAKVPGKHSTDFVHHRHLR